MTGRDIVWRLAGLTMTAGSCAAVLCLGNSALVVPLFLLALLGLPLAVHGRRVRQMIDAERGGHGRTIAVIHAARLRNGALRARRRGA